MSSWQKISLGELEYPEKGSFFMGPFGSNLKAAWFQDSGIPVLRGKNLAGISVSDENLTFISSEKIGPLYRSVARRGDLVVTHRGTIGQVSIIPPTSAFEEYLVSQSQLKLTLNQKRVNPLFLAYWFHSPLGQHELLSFSSQTGVPAIAQPLSNIRKISINLPSLSEQQEIATTLGALDDKIESNGQIIRLAEELIQTRFDELFDVDLVENGVPISALIRINPRRTLMKGKSSVYVAMASLPENLSSIYEWQRESFRGGAKFVNGDVLMARITPSLENGKTAIVNMLEDDEVGWGSTEFIVLSPNNNYSTPWIYALIRNVKIRDWAIKRMNGSSGRQRFNGNDFATYKISEPKTSHLDKFNALAIPLNERITQARDETLKLIALRDTLLPELMSGRIRVPEAMEAIDQDIEQ